MDAKDRAREKRLLKKYGITIADYDSILRQQGGVCKICKKPPKNNRLSTDHDHRFNRPKIRTTKLDCGKWWAVADKIFGGCYGDTKAEARGRILSFVMRKSVRGLLCSWCNRGLRYYHDNPVFLENAAQYLRDYNDRT